ncbi:hypothetical protein HYY69_08360 [Candidatus Woesearchaeota archaeon]|nr:hypothetical protein [Candidatus Woesearchaeota archaeon]
MERSQVLSLSIVAVVAVVAILLMVQMKNNLSKPSEASTDSDTNLVTGNVVKQATDNYANRVVFENVNYLLTPQGRVAMVFMEPMDSLQHTFEGKIYTIKYLGYANGCNFEVSKMSTYATEVLDTQHVTLDLGQETNVYGFDLSVFAKRHSFTNRKDYDCQVKFRTD